MYYIFKSVINVMDNELVQARLVGSPPLTSPHWWEASPLIMSLSAITFTVKREWKLPDNLFTGTFFDLYSHRLTEVLKNAGVRFETFPAMLIDESGNNIKSDYRIFHLLEKYSCLDYEQSEVDDNTLEIRKLVLSEKFISIRKLMFRVEGFNEVVLIHQDLKSMLEGESVTGCKYTPVNEYQTGLSKYFNQYKKDKLE